MLYEPVINNPLNIQNYVLILILMEYALRVYVSWEGHYNRHCLNPYSNGICSTSKSYLDTKDAQIVLILILMEYALRDLESGW